MASVARELVRIDRDGLDVKAGFLGLVVVAVFGVAILLVGPVMLAGAVGVLAVLATDPPPAGRSWAGALLPIVVGGAVLTFLAVAIDGRTLAAALLAGATGVLATLRAGSSRRAGVRTLVTSLWVVVALTLGGTGTSALAYAAAFAAGAALGTAVALVRARGTTAEGVGDDDVEGVPGSATVEESALDQARDALPFALLRGAGLAVAVLVGFSYFPDHPVWMAVTALLVMRPPTRDALVVGAQRSLGTGVGVVVAVALAGVVGDNRPWLVALFLVAAFVMMAVREVNYALFAAVTAALVVYMQRLLGADAGESGRDRVLETVAGVLLALAVLAIAERIARTREAD